MIELHCILPYMENQIIAWLNDCEICQYNSHAVFPVTSAKPSTDKDLRLAITDDGDFVGVISLQNINWVNRSAELAILVGKNQRQGIGKEACRQICKHGFNALNLHRIYCGIHEGNIGMVKVTEYLGMKQEGRKRQAMFKHGKYADTLHYGLLKEEFINKE